MAPQRVRRPVARWLSGLLVSVLLVAAVSVVVALLDPHVPALYLLVLYLLVVMPVAIVWGTALALFSAVLSAAVYAYVFLPPIPSLAISDIRGAIALGVFLVTAVVVGELAARLRRTAVRYERLSEAQSALRRVATLVARSAPSSAVFAAVTEEVGRLFGADLARMERYEDDGTVTGVAAWSDVPETLATGTQFELDGLSVARDVRESGGPVRLDSFAGATGAIAGEAHRLGIRSSVGCPIVVSGRLWGVIAASRRRDEPFPANTEAQIASFTELIVTAIENAESRAQLAASRARVVAASDETRRRIERDLHDGAQQRLVTLALDLRLAQEAVPDELGELRSGIGAAATGVTEVLDELREISRGIHPAILSEGGLNAALRTLARRSAVPVEMRVATRARYPQPVEAAAYYVVSEALTNAAKYAGASHVAVTLDERDGELVLCVSDDGVGGAEPRRGSGLVGLRDRVEALGGSIDVSSPAGQGTEIRVTLSIERADGDPERAGSPRRGPAGAPPP